MGVVTDGSKTTGTLKLMKQNIKIKMKENLWPHELIIKLTFQKHLTFKPLFKQKYKYIDCKVTSIDFCA